MYEKSTKGPVIYIRHAESKLNEVMMDPKNIHLKNSRELIDCGLTEKGKKQCEFLGKTLLEFKIKYVFISPLNRAIDTCYLSLKDHPEFNNFKFIILPLASEIIDSSCDIPCSLIEKKIRYQNYKNFDLNWEFYKDYFFLDNIDEPEFIEKLKDVNFSKYDENFAVYEKGLDQCKANDLSGESIMHLFKRGCELKLFFKNFLSTINLEDKEKILLFTHSAITKISTSSLAYSVDKFLDFPQDSVFLNNCEFLTMNVD